MHQECECRNCHKLENEVAQLIREVRILREQTVVDPLTCVLNVRGFEKEFDAMLDQNQRFGLGFCLALGDIDHFKRINDTYGHLVGDKVLRKVGKVLDSERRATDRVGRIGGEEFAILLPGTDLQGALTLVERLKKRIQNGVSAFISKHSPAVRCTASFGVAQYEVGQTRDELFAVADHALYQAKNDGRNKVVVAMGKAA
jgi:diguanylate cyclase (GGDEF)-like protein